MNEQDIKVDIIIPIYNAFEFTKKCIETVIENTDLKQNTLVLVNDKSPDEKILPMIKDFQEKNSDLNICIMDNEKNSGFVKTVNIGMKRSKNDVVLLNSDTEVTSKWLDKMKKVAYLKDNVATVTPLSNNATLASIPNFCEENDIPYGISLKEYAKDIEDCSLELFPEIPTAHGFCMYIKREALDKVGLFDEETFGQGYGEENDFSYRAMKNGYVHLLCDNTFIYHKGTQSFTEAKLELIHKNLKIIRDRHPRNFRLTDDFCRENPIEYIQDNVKYYMNNKYRKNVLFVVHEFRSRDSKLLGGTVLHIYDLIDRLRDKMNIHVFYPENGAYKVTSFFENSTSEIILGRANIYENIQLYNHEYQKICEQLFGLLNVDFVHIHHMMNHYFDIFDCINDKHIPYVVTLHDFYFACPNFVLLENNEKYCGDMDKPECSRCLKLTRNIGGDFIQVWRKVCYEALKKAKMVITPTESTKEIIQKYYKDLNIQAIEHGVERMEYEYKEEEKQEKKNIAIIGGINKVKGIDFLDSLIKKVNEENSNYRLHLFGDTSESKFNMSNRNYIYHGRYDRDDITKLLKENNIELVCIFSIWPETYSYTLTESLLAEIPVLVIGYGALYERTKRDNLGWILDKDVQIDGIMEKIEQIFKDEKEYKKVKNAIKKYLKNVKTVEQMAKEYEEIYNKFIEKQIENYNVLGKENVKYILKYSKQICDMEKAMLGRMAGHNHRIAEYHYTVTEYKKEIDRLNTELVKYQEKEDSYNRLLSSRRLKLLKKIRFIKF